LLLIEATGFWKLEEGLRQGFENFSAYIILLNKYAAAQRTRIRRI
jgi:hypothetical protein